MKLIPMRWAVAAVVASLALSAAGASDKKEKSTARVVDSGSFGVFVKGQRVLTETFTIHQENGISVIKAQLKEAPGSEPISQTSDLLITSSGELLRYEWSQPSGAFLTVLPDNDFLREKITAAGSSKPAEKPFLMPATSSILDNNFFIHREVLTWRYLAADCKPENGNLKCQQGPAQFGVLVPQDQNSISIRLELVGPEKISIRGTDRQLLRLNLSSDNLEWSLWVDPQDQFKLIRVAIPADNTEVVRD